MRAVRGDHDDMAAFRGLIHLALDHGVGGKAVGGIEHAQARKLLCERGALDGLAASVKYDNGLVAGAGAHASGLFRERVARGFEIDVSQGPQYG